MSSELAAGALVRFESEARVASRALALLLLAALAASLFLADLQPLALAGPLGLGLLFLRLRGFASASSALPNLVTAIRVILTSLLGSPWLGDDPRAQALLVLAVFTLDGVDGTLARRLAASSHAGAHFDMESDGYLVLMVCARLAHGGVGVWVLLGGLLRYAYAIATTVVPSRGQAPPSRFGRYAFSLALTALTLALIAPAPLCSALAGFGSGVLIWSFGRSFYWAFRAQP